MPHAVAPTLVEVVPEFEFKGGMFFVSCPVTGICRAYPPHLFFQTLARMAEVAREFRFAGAEVVPIAVLEDIRA